MSIKKETFQFLKDLKKNNDRDWFTANKDKYMAANQNTIDFTQTVINEIANFDKSVAGLDAKGSMFRIYRDTRFAKDKTPYRNHLGATIMGKGLGCGAGYCIHLEPGSTFIAGGVQMLEPAKLKALRQEISYNAKEFLKIMNDKNFKSLFIIEGEKLAKVPLGFDKEDPMGEYLKYKELIAKHYIDDKTMLSPDFAAYCAKVFKAVMPFNTFVNKAVMQVK